MPCNRLSRTGKIFLFRAAYLGGWLELLVIPGVMPTAFLGEHGAQLRVLLPRRGPASAAGYEVGKAAPELADRRELQSARELQRQDATHDHDQGLLAVRRKVDDGSKVLNCWVSQVIRIGHGDQ
jgi:hypothetical protein